jgi:hypothetical protein
MTELGSFGPGWFYSIFGITVEFDNATLVLDDGEVFAVPWFSFNGQAYLYSGDDSVIRGTIKLNTYNNNREVWHGGITVKFFVNSSADENRSPYRNIFTRWILTSPLKLRIFKQRLQKKIL